jgi:hypothetical protein
MKRVYSTSHVVQSRRIELPDGFAAQDESGREFLVLFHGNCSFEVSQAGAFPGGVRYLSLVPSASDPFPWTLRRAWPMDRPEAASPGAGLIA